MIARRVKAGAAPMPSLLMFITAMCFFPLAMAVGSAVPSGEHTLYGRELAFSQWWSTGAGVLFALAGLVPAAGALAMMRRLAAGRIACVIGLAIQCVVIPVCAYLVFGEWPPAAILEPLWWLGFAGPMAAYLFLARSVKRYFAESSSTAHQ